MSSQLVSLVARQQHDINNQMLELYQRVDMLESQIQQYATCANSGWTYLKNTASANDCVCIQLDFNTVIIVKKGKNPISVRVTWNGKTYDVHGSATISTQNYIGIDTFNDDVGVSFSSLIHVAQKLGFE